MLFSTTRPVRSRSYRTPDTAPLTPRAWDHAPCYTATALDGTVQGGSGSGRGRPVVGHHGDGRRGVFDDGMGDMADVRAPADRAGCDRPTTTGSAPSAAADR
jgi:hypothetical protein